LDPSGSAPSVVFEIREFGERGPDWQLDIGRAGRQVFNYGEFGFQIGKPAERKTLEMGDGNRIAVGAGVLELQVRDAE
jgi:hypothetical protein